MQLRVARQRAIAERKHTLVCFGAASAPLGALTPKGAPLQAAFRCSVGIAGTALSAAVQISTNDLPVTCSFRPWPVSRTVRQRCRMALETEGLRSTLTKASRQYEPGHVHAGMVPRTIRVEIMEQWASSTSPAPAICTARTQSLYTERQAESEDGGLLSGGASPKWFVQ